MIYSVIVDNMDDSMFDLVKDKDRIIGTGERGGGIENGSYDLVGGIGAKPVHWQ